VMPVAALAAARLELPTTGTRTRIAVGIVLVAGGLAGLAVLPRAGWLWTVPPQILLGAGLGLALATLTEQSLGGGGDKIVHGGWAVAARHVGVVAGLVLLAPLLTTALERNEELAVRAGTAEVLDSRIPALDKLFLAQDVLAEVDDAEREGRLPDVDAVFEDRPDDDEHGDLLESLRDQLHRAVTDAFSGPFLLAACLAVAALVPLALLRVEER
jgi:hypothetical protein